jgi:hypothetical protein
VGFVFVGERTTFYYSCYQYLVEERIKSSALAGKFDIWLMAYFLSFFLSFFSNKSLKSKSLI